MSSATINAPAIGEIPEMEDRKAQVFQAVEENEVDWPADIPQRVIASPAKIST